MRNLLLIFLFCFAANSYATPDKENALEYVLLNLSKHQKLIEYIDHFSSGSFFRQWPKLLGKKYRSLIKNDAEFFEGHKCPKDLSEVLSMPQSWLAQTGWMKACA